MVALFARRRFHDELRLGLKLWKWLVIFVCLYNFGLDACGLVWEGVGLCVVPAKLLREANFAFLRCFQAVIYALRHAKALSLHGGPRHNYLS